MTFHRFSLLTGTLLALASYAHAGVGFDYQNQNNERSGAGRPFNFGVSTTSHCSPGLGVWTPQDISGKNLGGGHHQLSVRRGLQVDRHEEGTFSTFQSVANSSKNRRQKDSNQGGGMNAGGSLPSFGQGNGASELTNGQRPVNTRYCYCPGNPGGDDGDDDDDDSTGDDDDGGGQTGDDDDDDDNGGGEGGGPDPSVVPEPGSFALWALAGALLVGTTRRQTRIQ